MNITKAYDYDDVLVRPIPSFVSSRDDVDISVVISKTLTLQFPLIASPMVGVVNANFARKLSDLGGLAIFHRFYKDHDEMYWDVKIAKSHGDINFGISVKVNDSEFPKHLEVTNPNIILVDTANGYTENVLRYCEKIKSYIVNHNLKAVLMAGNVATGIGVKHLYQSGCDIIRVGIGGGSVCSTRNQTGIGIPNISALIDISDTCSDYDCLIVADGGIRTPGDFVKSIVAGANLCMSGRLYAECFESPNEGALYGMASRVHMEKTNLEIKSVEGFDTKITKKYPLEQFLREFGYGIKSAGTYLNAHSLLEIYFNGSLVEVSDHAIKKGVV